jgi:hypothetical protein
MGTRRPAADICVATVTWARDTDEEALIRRALTTLSAAALPIVVADGGSSSRFVSSLRRVPHLTFAEPEGRGLVPQVKAALAAAARLQYEFILYTESDKQMFFEQKLERFLLNPPAADDVGVVIAARSDESFATFPRTQRVTESAINALTGDVVGHQGDYSYGPFLLNRRLAGYLDPLPADIGWGWRHYLFAVIARLGLRVVHVIDDLPCPQEQRADVEREHRLKQLTQNVSGLLLGMELPLND